MSFCFNRQLSENQIADSSTTKWIDRTESEKRRFVDWSRDPSKRISGENFLRNPSDPSSSFFAAKNSNSTPGEGHSVLGEEAWAESCPTRNRDPIKWVEQSRRFRSPISASFRNTRRRSRSNIRRRFAAPIPVWRSWPIATWSAARTRWWGRRWSAGRKSTASPSQSRSRLPLSVSRTIKNILKKYFNFQGVIFFKYFNHMFGSLDRCKP